MDEQGAFHFPFQGIELSTGLNAQRPGTTPVGQNVRAQDALALRIGGGSRPGLSSLLGGTTQVSGFNLVQHLNQIVWVSRNALSPGNTFVPIHLKINYSETDNPPARNAPQVIYDEQWFIDTAPNFFNVKSGVLSPPDGGGTGQGTASFKIGSDGVTVTLTCSFVSAGFPGPYLYSGNPQSFTLTQSNALFFNPATSQIASNWTVVDTVNGFIGNYFFDVFYDGM